ncbi:MAG: hypothetical protein JNJ60_19940, partial [Rhodocyclaceae bacterium]|nr:hypothetical protein [Rhodocyclaceae bacterium]
MNRLALVTCAAALLLAPRVHAGTADEAITISGFGTAGVSCFSSRTADYALNLQPLGPGRSRRCDHGLDSILGIQLDAKLGSTLELGIQGVTERNPNRSFKPNAMVAQLRWRPDDNWTIRLGRSPFAGFLYSESRQVRYAMPWARPPVEVYGIAPVFSTDGIEILHRRDLGNWHAELHGGLGRSHVDSAVSNTRDISHVNARYGFINLALQRDATQFKLGYMSGRAKADSESFDAFLNLLRGLGADGEALADDLNFNHKTIHFLTAGLRHERGDWLIMGEVAIFLSESDLFRRQYGAYLTLGHNMGAWMPYATLARRSTSGPEGDSRAGPFAPQIAQLLKSQHSDETSVSL